MAAAGGHVAAEDCVQLGGTVSGNGGLAERVGLGVERDIELLAGSETGGSNRDVPAGSGLASHAVAGDGDLRADGLGQVNGDGGVGGLVLVIEAGQRRRGLPLGAGDHVPELGRLVLQVDGLGLPLTDLDDRLRGVLGALGREIGRGITLGGVDSTDRQRRRDAVIGGGLVDPGEPGEGQGQGGCPGKDTLLHLSSPLFRAAQCHARDLRYTIDGPFG